MTVPPSFSLDSRKLIKLKYAAEVKLMRYLLPR